MSMNNNYSNNSHNNNSHNDNNNLQFTEEMFQNYNKILQQQTNSILNNKINSHNNNHNQNNQSNKSHESFTNSQVNDQNYSNLEQLFALKAPQPPAMSHTFIPSTTTQPVQRTPNTYLQNYLPPPLPNTKAMSYPPTNQTVAQNPVPAPAANNNNPLAALPPHLYEQFKQFLMVQSSAQPAPVNQFNQQQQQQQQLLGGYNTNTPSTTLPQTLSQTLPQLNANPYTQTPNLLAGMLGLPSNDINSLPNNPSAVAVSSILQQQLMLQQLMQLQLQQLQTPNQANPFPNMMSPPMNNNNNPFLALPSFNNSALPTQNIPTIPSFPLNTPNVPLSAPLPQPSAPKSNTYHAPNPPPAQAPPVQGTTTGRPNNSHPSISHLSYEDVMGTRGQGNPPHSVRPEHTKAKPSSSSLLSPHQDFTLQDISAMIESATKNIRENAHLIATNMVCRVNGIKLDRLHQLASATLKDLNDHHATTNATTTTTTTTNSGRMILGDGSGELPLAIPSSTSFILKKKKVNEIEEDISGEDDQNNYNKKKRKIEGNHDEMNLTNNISNDNHSSSSIEIKIKKRKKKLPPLYDENGNIIPRKRGRPRKDNLNSSSSSNNNGNDLLSPPDELIDPLPLRSFPNNELQKRAESIVNEIVAGLMSKNNNKNTSSSNTATSAIQSGNHESTSIEGIIKKNDMDVLKNGITMMNSMHRSDDVDSFDDEEDDEDDDDEEEEEEEEEFEDYEDDDIISQKDDGGDSEKKVSFNNTIDNIPIQVVQNSTIITESDQPTKDVIELTEEVIQNEEAKKEAVTPLKTINRKEEMEEEDGEELLSEASEEEEEEARPSSQKKRESNTPKDPKSNKRLDSRSKGGKKQEQEKVRRTSRSSQQDEFSEEVEAVKNSSEVEQEIMEEEEGKLLKTYGLMYCDYC